MIDMFFNNWTALIRVGVVGVSSYAALILLLRVSGKRTLSKLNAFDFIIMIALGSTLATVILSKDVALAEGILAFALLIMLQFIITWLSVRSKTVNRLVKGEPTLLFHHGEFLCNAMKDARINKGEILQAMRSQGVSRKEQVEAVILETDGKLSILSKAQYLDITVFDDSV